MMLQHVHDKLKDDEQLVLLAIRNNAHSLNHASDRIKCDQDIVLKAIVKDGMCLQ